jgi:hypothetical protein
MSKKSNLRADVKNPNNLAYKAAHDNTANQLNSNHHASKPEVKIAPKVEVESATKKVQD